MRQQATFPLLSEKERKFMNATRVILFISILIVLTGCSIASKNMVGLEEYKLDPNQINGMWLNESGSALLKVIDPDKGIVRVVALDETEKTDIIHVKIMKGKSWLYFNLLPDNGNGDESYTWGRIEIKENKIIAWYPSNEAFLKAIDDGKIQGTRNPDCITDIARNIIDLVETSEKPFFLWSEPLFLIRLVK